jgi:TRAP-type C4-dicarboxylate transport system substrate-binding protein
MHALSRRHVLAGAAAVAASAGLPGAALAATKLRFADVTTADAPRSLALTNIFAKEMGADYEFQGYFGSTLFKQGTELVAVQRGNLEMAMLPPSDFAKQAPEFDILGAAYVVRDADHLNKIFESDVGEEFRKKGPRETEGGDPGARLLRSPPHQPQGKQEGVQAGGLSQRQASHAGRRKLAVPR